MAYAIGYKHARGLYC